MKFPLLLAVVSAHRGLATKILPHNFVELTEASITAWPAFELLPDFQTYRHHGRQQLQRRRTGGKIRVRAVIEEADKKTPVTQKCSGTGVTPPSWMESIVKAKRPGKDWRSKK